MVFEGEGDLRLTPEMTSRKLQALEVVKSYYLKWGYSPALSEIAAKLGISRKRAHELVGQLAAERMIEVVAGRRRGIRLVDRAEEISEADMLLRLAALGFTIAQGDYVIEPKTTSLSRGDKIAAAIARGVTKKGLLKLPVLDHKPVPVADRAAHPPGGPAARDGAGAEARGKTNEQSDDSRLRSAAARRAPRSKPGSLGATAP